MGLLGEYQKRSQGPKPQLLNQTAQRPPTAPQPPGVIRPPTSNIEPRSQPPVAPYRPEYPVDIMEVPGKGTVRMNEPGGETYLNEGTTMMPPPPVPTGPPPERWEGKEFVTPPPMMDKYADFVRHVGAAAVGQGLDAIKGLTFFLEDIDYLKPGYEKFTNWAGQMTEGMGVELEDVSGPPENFSGKYEGENPILDYLSPGWWMGSFIPFGEAMKLGRLGMYAATGKAKGLVAGVGANLLTGAIVGGPGKAVGGSTWGEYGSEIAIFGGLAVGARVMAGAASFAKGVAITGGKAAANAGRRLAGGVKELVNGVPQGSRAKARQVAVDTIEQIGELDPVIKDTALRGLGERPPTFGEMRAVLEKADVDDDVSKAFMEVIEEEFGKKFAKKQGQDYALMKAKIARERAIADTTPLKNIPAEKVGLGTRVKPPIHPVTIDPKTMGRFRIGDDITYKGGKWTVTGRTSAGWKLTRGEQNIVIGEKRMQEAKRIHPPVPKQMKMEHAEILKKKRGATKIKKRHRKRK